MNKSKLWTKDFIIMSVSTFFGGLTFYLLITTLTVYAVEEFNASQSMAGLASSIFVVGALVSRLFAGKYIEIIGRKKMLYGGLFLFLIVMLLYFIVENMNVLLLIRFVHGAAFGVFTTAIAAVVMDIIPNERRGEGISYFSLSITLAMAVGPFLGLYLSQQVSFTMIFVVCTLFSLISTIILLFVHIPEGDITKEQLEAMKGFKLKDFFEIKAVPISIIIAIMGFAYSGILSFINSYAKEIDLIDTASFFFIVYAVFILISRPFTGRLLDKKGDNIVIYPALVLFVIGLVILNQATPWIHSPFSRCTNWSWIWNAVVLLSSNCHKGITAAPSGACNLNLFRIYGFRSRNGSFSIRIYHPYRWFSWIVSNFGSGRICEYLFVLCTSWKKETYRKQYPTGELVFKWI